MASMVSIKLTIGSLVRRPRQRRPRAFCSDPKRMAGRPSMPIISAVFLLGLGTIHGMGCGKKLTPQLVHNCHVVLTPSSRPLEGHCGTALASAVDVCSWRLFQLSLNMFPITLHPKIFTWSPGVSAEVMGCRTPSWWLQQCRHLLQCGTGSVAFSAGALDNERNWSRDIHRWHIFQVVGD